MKTTLASTLAALLMLSACAMPGAEKPDYMAKNRPLEERCANVQQKSAGVLAPGQTGADVRAEAAAAAKRGELDKACDWL